MLVYQEGNHDKPETQLLRIRDIPTRADIKGILKFGGKNMGIVKFLRISIAMVVPTVHTSPGVIISHGFQAKTGG